jgi:hypothetical protein
MSNHCNHNVRVVGRPPDLDRFVDEFGIVAGAIDMRTGNILDDWLTRPSLRLNLPRGLYQVEKCLRGVCCVDIEFHTSGTTRESWVTVCRGWIDSYPELSIIWRYWFDLERYSGYVDSAGDHLWRYKNGLWVDAQSNPSRDLVVNFGTHDAALYVLSPLSRETIKHVALSAIGIRDSVVGTLMRDIDGYQTRYEFTWSHTIMTTATAMLEADVADKLWRRYEGLVSELEVRDPTICHAVHDFSTLNEAARYVLEPLRNEVTLEIVKEALALGPVGAFGTGTWVDIIVEAAADVLEMSKDAIVQYVRKVDAGNDSPTAGNDMARAATIKHIALADSAPSLVVTVARNETAMTPVPSTGTFAPEIPVEINNDNKKKEFFL